MRKYFPLGDTAFLIKLGNDISIETHRKVRNLFHNLESEEIEGVIELVPSYNEIMILYEPSIISYKDLFNKIEDIDFEDTNKLAKSHKIIHIPVCYDKKYSPDMEIVAQANQISQNEVVKIHSNPEYLVYMLGFTPGFCYLGGMDNSIATPRKENPRQLIEAGSVGIAGAQTGVYPIDSPGGWQIIGKTPLVLFDPKRKPEFLINAGDYIKFYAISEMEFEEIRKEVSGHSYELKVERKNG